MRRVLFQEAEAECLQVVAGIQPGKAGSSFHSLEDVAGNSVWAVADGAMLAPRMNRRARGSFMAGAVLYGRVHGGQP